MSIPRFRLTEPVGGFDRRTQRIVIVPAGHEGQKAQNLPGERGQFALIIDENGGEFDMVRCPELLDEQVEWVTE